MAGSAAISGRHPEANKHSCYHAGMTNPHSRIHPCLRFSAVASCAALLFACSPKYDWRQTQGGTIPFTAMLPAKPATHSRPVNLDGTQVTMTMTAAEVDGVTFAVATAELPDAAQAQRAIAAMKTGMVRNINGNVTKESTTAASGVISIDVEAAGQQRLLRARFVAKGPRVYQALVLGPEKSVNPESVEVFLSSFKPG